MQFNLKFISALLCLISMSYSMTGQFQDSIPSLDKITTPIAVHSDPSGSYLSFGTEKLLILKYKLNKSGLEKVDESKYSSQADMLDVVSGLKNGNKEIIYEDITIYEQNFKGSGLGGYFAPFEFTSSRRNISNDKGKEVAEWPIALEKTKVDSWEKQLSTSFYHEGTNYSLLVAGHKIKKDKTKKNNENKDFDVFIYNGEKLKKFSTNIKSKWGIIPNSAGVITDEKGEHKGFYVEFDLGGSADGLGKINKEATDNTKFISLLDLRGKFIRTVEIEMPINMGTTTYSEFYTNNVLLINEKLHIYAATRDEKIFSRGDWVPGYFYFIEQDDNLSKYMGNPSYVDYRRNVSDFSVRPPRPEDLSDKLLLKNGNLFSFGSSTGVNFKYMTTNKEGGMVAFGSFATTHDRSETVSPFKYVAQEVNEDFYAIVTYIREVGSQYAAPFRIYNDYILISKNDGRVIPIRPQVRVSNEKLMTTKDGIISYGFGVKNPNTIHIAHSPNYLEK